MTSTRISKKLRKEFIKRLSKWQTAGEFERCYTEIVSQIDSETFFNQGGLGFLRDAFVASEVASACRVKKVRLVEADRPDFELETTDGLELFEATEAFEPGRRRGLEYRNIAEGDELEDDPGEDWFRRGRAGIQWLRMAAENKAENAKDGKYGDGVNLAIYLNMNEFDVLHDEVLSKFPAATIATRSFFNTVLVLWKGTVYCVWQERKVAMRQIGNRRIDGRQ